MRYVYKFLMTFFFSTYLLMRINSNEDTIRKGQNNSWNDKKKTSLDSMLVSEELRPIKILIDPGHGPYDGITKIYGTRKNHKENSLSEFDITYKISENIRQELEKDPRFEVKMTKNLYDYDQEFKDFCSKNQSYINKLYPHGIIVFGNGKKLNIDSLKSINKKDPKRTKNDWKKLYAIFLYSQDFDIYISPHLDYSGRKIFNGRKLINEEYVDSGYTIIINPYSKKFEETKILAETLSSELSKINNITTTKIMNSRYSSKKIGNQVKKLNNNGIALRNLAVLGNRKNYGNNIAVLIEYEHLKQIDTSYAFINLLVKATTKSIYKTKNIPMLEDLTQR